MPKRALTGFENYAERRLARVLKLVSSLKGTGGRGPKRKPWQCELQFLSSVAMKKLNFKYRKKNYPTDILSFPAADPFRGLGHLGELVICQPVLKRQAREEGHSEKAELDVLLVHGVLHLLGFDHEKSAAQAKQMSRREMQVLERLGSRRTSLIARSQSGNLPSE